MSNYPIENYFRPAVEYIPAITSTTAAIIIVGGHEWLFLPQPLAIGGSLLLLSHAAMRFREGRYVTRFKRNLTRLPKYIINTTDIPVSKKRLFLGLGFKWTQKHTQRLIQARDPNNEVYVKQSWLYYKAREWEFQYENSQSKLVQKLIKFTEQDSRWNPVKSLPPVGGDPLLHGVEPNEKMITMDIGERVGHMAVLGTTRVGKTRLAEVLITQDIRRGDVVIVFDPKGDAELMKRCYIEAKKAGREFFMFHLGYPDKSARYNPIGNFSRITEVSTRIAGQLPGDGQSAAFREFVWRFVNIIARVRSALGYRPDYSQIYSDAVNIDALALEYFESWLDKKHQEWRNEIEEVELDKHQIQQAQRSGRNLDAIRVLHYIQGKNLHDPIADGLMSVLSNDRSYFEKLVSSLYPLLEKLTTGKIAEIISPNYEDMTDERPIFDWMNVIERGGVVYVGLDSLSDYEVAGAVGNAMFADLTSIAGQIYKTGHGHGLSGAIPKRKLSIHADEFNELIGDEFIPLLNKAGGAGYQVTVYTQTWSDVEARLESKAKAEQISGNLNNLVMLRVKNKETAEILTNQLPEVNVSLAMQGSATTDSSDDRDIFGFTTRNEDRISTQSTAVLSPGDIVQLPKGQAFALIEGGQLYKIRLPLFDANEQHNIPSDLIDVAEDMERKYDELYLKHLNSEVDNLDLRTRSNQSITVEGKGSGF